MDHGRCRRELGECAWKPTLAVNDRIDDGHLLLRCVDRRGNLSELWIAVGAVLGLEPFCR
jgi:hypothetical protein